MKNRAIYVLFFIYISSNITAQEMFQKRNFYVDAGAGAGANYYSFFDSISGKWQMDSSFFVSAGAGYSPLLQWMYITANVMYNSETNSLLDESVTVQMITFSGGLRLYPLESRKYLQIGLDAGISFADGVSTVPGVLIPANTGPGFTVTGIFAYDFSRYRLGPALQAGSQVSYTVFDGNWRVSSGVFVKLALKGIRLRNAPSAVVDDTADMVLAFPLAAVLGAAVACWGAYRGLPYGDRSHLP